ncbi:MAG: PhzF family phenazine biosynthesis protein [Oscillospiraceae bacterium]
MKFQIVDAFTRQTFGGNPAGVVLLPEGADFPADETMRKTAAELRYSETAFIRPLGGNRFHIRYFTPAAEVELCGHATIGSFHALQEMGLVAEGGTYIDETLSVRWRWWWARTPSSWTWPSPRLPAAGDAGGLEELYHIMGLSADGQGAVTGKPELTLLPQKVSTGLTDIMMPVADEAELEKIAPDFPALTEHSRRYNVVGVHAFTVNTTDGMIHARNFAPLYDIDEEAATGTSNGALVYYLYRHGLVELDKVYTVVQGEKMGRPSMISAQVILKDSQPFVKVGGPAVTLVRGEIEL